MPITDTLKEGTLGGATLRSYATLDRVRYWCAQTPQMFRYSILCKALSQENALSCTDESQAVEHYCKQTGNILPLLLRGSLQNIKLTYAEDLIHSEAILAFQKLQ